MAKLEKEIHQLAAQALNQQERALAELRARTGTLLTAAALVASFLGGPALEHGGPGIWISLALVAFCLSISLCIYVLLPHKGLRFSLDTAEVYTALSDIREADAEVERSLAEWLHLLGGSNHRTVERLTNAFELASFALLAEIILLAVGHGVS